MGSGGTSHLEVSGGGSIQGPRWGILQLSTAPTSQFPARQARVPSNWVKKGLGTKRKDTNNPKPLNPRP